MRVRGVCGWYGPLLLALCLVGVTPSWAGRNLVIERILAVVNGEIILWSVWKQQYEAFKARVPKGLDDSNRACQLEQMGMQLLTKMVNDKLIEQQAKKLQVQVTDQEVAAAVKDTQRRNNVTDEQFREALREQGYTLASYRAMVRRELQKLRLLQRVLRQKISVTEEEIRKYYNDMTRGLKRGAMEYRVRQILIPVPPKAKISVLTQQKLLASNVLKLALQQQTRANFIRLVRRFSKGPWRDKDGDLGFLGEDSLPQVIANVTKQLKVKKVYPKLLRSTLGYHIIFLEGVRSEGVLSYKEARANIKKKLQQIAFQREYKRYLKKLRQEAVIDVRLKLSKACQQVKR